ncbi:MoxR-like ATPase [Actinomycetota bacterium]|nr:MoxR-like ATPase [Actinomycetota bacterium]
MSTENDKKAQSRTEALKDRLATATGAFEEVVKQQASSAPQNVAPSNTEQYAKASTIEQNDLIRASDVISRISAIFRQRVVGQESLWNSMMMSLIADGHILIESVPGLAKTTAAEVLCAAIQGKFARIQCTPDLMPSDIVGSQIYNYGSGDFTTQLGPVHANLVLLDEINRSSAKTQSAMLEAMQERQTTIGDTSYKLPDQFMVIATQNPIEEEGTYVLPEAQMDRFLLKEIITYPTPEEEVEILNNVVAGKFDEPLRGYVVSLDDISYIQNLAKKVFVSPAIIHYIISVISTSRGGGPNPIVGLNKLIRVGASPRASIAFIRVCQALALLQGRGYVIPEDVKDVRYAVLRHRILRTFDAMAEDVLVETIIDRIFQVVPAP